MRNKIVPILLLLLLLCGCGEERYVSVSGSVSVDGQPASDIRVLFTWKDPSKPSADTGIGFTDSQGRFRLKSLMKEKSGVEPGTYSVSFDYRDPNAPKDQPDDAVIPPPPFFLTKEAIDGSMTFTVPVGGTNNADFDLKTSKTRVIFD